MFFYAFGSLLFALAMLSAITVMAADFAQYWRAMMTALRGLTLDGLDVRSTAADKSLVSSAPVSPAKVLPLWPKAVA